MIRTLGVFRAVAGVTCRGFMLDGAFLAGVAGVPAALAAAALLAPASLGSGARLAEDFGWGAAGLFAWLLAVGHGSGLYGRGGVVLPAVLARPVAPALLLGARYAGLLAGLAVYVGAGTLSMALRFGGSAESFAAGWLLLLRVMVVLALAIAFFALTRPPLAALLTAAAAAAGWFSGRLPGLETAGPIPMLAEAGRWILPDLARLDTARIESGRVGFDALVGPTVYALLYSGGILAAALAVFGVLLRRSGR